MDFKNSLQNKVKNSQLLKKVKELTAKRKPKATIKEIAKPVSIGVKVLIAAGVCGLAYVVCSKAIQEVDAVQTAKDMYGADEDEE